MPSGFGLDHFHEDQAKLSKARSPGASKGEAGNEGWPAEQPDVLNPKPESCSPRNPDYSPP